MVARLAVGFRVVAVGAVAYVPVALWGAAPAWAASSVSNLVFTPTSTAGGATGVWDISFVATTGLAGSSGYITVAAPAGTTFAGGSCEYGTAAVLEDITTGATSGKGKIGCVAQSLKGTELTVYVPAGITINPGNGVSLTIYDVVNPPAGATYSALGISTSSDTTPINPTTGTFGAAKAISGLSFSPTTSNAGGATGVWSISFKTSATGALTNDPYSAFDDNGSYVTVLAPAGTEFKGGSCEYGTPDILEDLTTGATSGKAKVACPAQSLKGTDLTVYVPVGMNVNPGDSVSLTIYDVVNPPPGALYAGLRVSTSSDTTPTSPTRGTFSAAKSLSGLSFSSVTEKGKAVSVWSISFKSSVTGGLSTDPYSAFDDNGSYVSVAAPAGTEFKGGSCEFGSADILEDLTTGITSGGGKIACPAQSLKGTDLTVFVPAGMTINPGDGVRLTIPDVVNPPAGPPPHRSGSPLVPTPVQ